jgi:hypothetical protein
VNAESDDDEEEEDEEWEDGEAIEVRDIRKLGDGGDGDDDQVSANEGLLIKAVVEQQRSLSDKLSSGTIQSDELLREPSIASTVDYETSDGGKHDSHVHHTPSSVLLSASTGKKEVDAVRNQDLAKHDDENANHEEELSLAKKTEQNNGDDGKAFEEDGDDDDDDYDEEELIQMQITEEFSDIIPSPKLATLSKTTSTQQQQQQQQQQPELDLLKLQKKKNQLSRDSEHVTDQMVEDVKELLDLFGIPYITVSWVCCLIILLYINKKWYCYFLST